MSLVLEPSARASLDGVPMGRRTNEANPRERGYLTMSAVGDRAARDVQLIIEGEHSYAKIPTETRVIAPGVHFYGSPGHSSSVGAWIRATYGLYEGQGLTTAAWAFWAADSEDLAQKSWYFAIEIADELYVVGGCTDYSGEGGHARAIAEAYLLMYKMDIQIRPVSDLIDWMVDGWGFETRKEGG